MTNIVHPFSQSPYKLAPGEYENSYNIVLDGRVIGSVQRSRRMVGRQLHTQYVVRDSDGAMIGTRESVDVAADFAYDTWLTSQCVASGVAVGADLWLVELEFIARLHLQSSLSYTNAIYALVMWRELHDLAVQEQAVIEHALQTAVRKVAGL